MDGLQVTRIDSASATAVTCFASSCSARPTQQIDSRLLDDDAADFVSHVDYPWCESVPGCPGSEREGAIEADQFVFRALAFGDVFDAAANERHTAAASRSASPRLITRRISRRAHQLQLDARTPFPFVWRGRPPGQLREVVGV